SFQNIPGVNFLVTTSSRGRAIMLQPITASRLYTVLDPVRRTLTALPTSAQELQRLGESEVARGDLMVRTGADEESAAQKLSAQAGSLEQSGRDTVELGQRTTRTAQEQQTAASGRLKDGGAKADAGADQVRQGLGTLTDSLDAQSGLQEKQKK